MAKLSYNTKVAVTVLGVFFGLLIVGVTLIFVFLKKTTPSKQTPNVSPIPTPTPSPVTTNNVLLKDGSGKCFTFGKLSPTLGSTEPCDGTYWIHTVSTSTNTVTYNGLIYEFCIQNPAVANTSVIGTTGSACNGVSILDNNMIKSSNNLCIVNFGGVLSWGDCSAGYVFNVVKFTL